MRLGQSLITLLVLLACCCSPVLEASKKGRHLALEEVATVWIGLSGDEIFLIRLQLDVDGTGRGSYVYLDKPARLFHIPGWTYREGQLRVRIEFVEPAPRDATIFQGRVVGVRMELRMMGPDWDRKVFLRQETVWFARWQRLRESMQEEPSVAP